MLILWKDYIKPSITLENWARRDIGMDWTGLNDSTNMHISFITLSPRLIVADQLPQLFLHFLQVFEEDLKLSALHLHHSRSEAAVLGSF